ncbi:MAG TPA: antitoxin [Porphyromonadaceae bacterium]|jgi:uncharacterized protein (UPF0332 family)|uniref:HEPN domain-containing protein n=1 Tax=Limibacterium fermenti TaxID=3229863 RepID=UPI000E827B7F|nr:antitoxin [Porphyromonadaceae bacterium]
MKLTDEEKAALIHNRVNRAFETWQEAKGIIANEYWYAAANRMYYACYYMTSALLLKNNYFASTHSGVIRLLGLHFIRTGIISDEWGSFYSRLFELRQSGDYDDWAILGADDILPLVDKVEGYLQELYRLI